jgi:hypothetical protein
VTHKKHLARQTLAAAADALSAEIWQHKWDHLPEVARPVNEWRELIAELNRRSPGHSEEAYRDAIARSLLRR